jgi:hypothetical protein
MPGESSEKTSEPQQSERLGRVRDLGARDARHLTKRFARDAHSASDAVIDVATVAPSTVNRLVAQPGPASPSDDDN